MRRIALAALVGFSAIASAADGFDRLTRPDLARAADAGLLKAVDHVSAAELTELAGRAPKLAAAVAVVHTRDGRWAKLLLVAARQKLRGEIRPALLVDRFATFRDGEDRQTVAVGRSVLVFPGTQFSLDLGQVVPPEVGGDLDVSLDPAGGVVVRPVGPARLFLAESALPAAGPPAGDRPKPGDPFQPRFVAGTYQLHDDGRRSGRLTLAVDDVSGEVSGEFYSDADGRRYAVAGRLGQPKHLIMFRIRFPQSEQSFTGYVFTGDFRAIAGTCKLSERESGFYAVRVEN